MIKCEDVSRYYTTDGKDCWQLVWFMREPSACLKNVESGQEISGGICSLNLKDFVKLIPEDDSYQANKITDGIDYGEQ